MIIFPCVLSQWLRQLPSTPTFSAFEISQMLLLSSFLDNISLWREKKVTFLKNVSQHSSLALLNANVLQHYIGLILQPLKNENDSYQHECFLYLFLKDF